MRLMVAVAVLALGAAACGGADGGGEAISAGSPPPVARARAGNAGLIQPDDRDPAPDFSVTTTSGETFSLNGAARPFVMSFLAVGCASCTYMVGQLAETHSRLGGRTQVLLLDLAGLANDDVDRYYRTELGGGPHLYAADEGFRVADAYGVKVLGQTYVIDGRGRIAFAGVDPAAGELVGAVRSVLDGSVAPAGAGAPERHASSGSAEGVLP